MARAVHRLTDVVVRRAMKPGMYADGAGLYLRVGLTGGKAWIFRYRRGAKLHDLGLGPLHTISLASARRRAQQLREQRLDGVDLIAVRKASRIEAGRGHRYRPGLEGARTDLAHQTRDGEPPAWAD